MEKSLQNENNNATTTSKNPRLSAGNSRPSPQSSTLVASSGYKINLPHINSSSTTSLPRLVHNNNNSNNNNTTKPNKEKRYIISDFDDDSSTATDQYSDYGDESRRSSISGYETEH